MANPTHPTRPSLRGRQLRSIAYSLFTGLLLLVLLWTAPARAQGTTGSITGTVSDSTGAPIPGATVTITQVDTNAARTVTTSDIGTYRVTQLTPGVYRVKVEMPAFKTFQQDNLTLAIGQIAQIDPQLQVGTQDQTVNVTSGAPVIQTEDSSIGLVVDSQAIQNTPLNGRLSVIGLIALAPGVQQAGAQDQVPVFGVTPAIGTGSRNAYGGTGFTLDGVTNAEVTLQRGEGEVPPIDALSEFKVISNSAPAEFNQPAQVIVVSQGGGNQLHGEVLEYNRSKGTSAKEYFAGSKPRPPYQRNEFGGNLNGPIVIPKIYNGKDRSFFFFSYEGFRLQQSSQVSSQQPTVAMRGGDFSAFLPTTVIKDPLTGTPFPGNIIPASRFNAVDVQLANILLPMPTQAGTGINTIELVPFSSHVDRYATRLDHRLTSKDQLRGTMLFALYGPNPTVGVSSKAGGNSGTGEHNTNIIVGWTHTFSPTLLLDTSASYFHLPIYRTPQNVNTNFSAIIPGLGPELIQGAPTLNITNITSLSESGSKDLEQVEQINTSLTKVFSRHTVKAGFSYLFDNHWNVAAQAPQRGAYNFSGQYSGNAYADFLLGYPFRTQNAVPNNFITRNLSSQYGMYLQDDFKPIPRLTINIGLRYDLQHFEDSPYGNGALFVPSLGKVVVFSAAYPSQTVPALLNFPVVLAPSVGLPTSLFGYLGQDKNNVAPRLGFAYQIFPKTVLRGATGIFFNLLPASYIGSGGFANLPFATSETFDQPTGSVPTITMNNPFSATGSFAANPGVFAQHSTVTPYTEQYNLALEQQIGKTTNVRIGYVGQHNLKQNNYGGPGNTAPDINLPVPAAGSVQPRRPVQPFSTINVNMDPIFYSNMNSLQIGLHKQYDHGFQFNAEYQWIRVLGTENFQNPATVNDSYGPIAGITPQSLVLNYTYILPVGKNQFFLATAGPWVDKLVSGWQVSGLTSFQSGQPFSVTNTPTAQGDVSGRANRVLGVPLYAANQSIRSWINPAAFTAPPAFTYGTSGYDMLRGPRFQNWDINLQKNTVFRERYRIQLRADAFNVFNHPSFNTPSAAVNNQAAFGTITSTASTARKMEFAAKFNF